MVNSGNPGLQPVGLSAATGYARQTGSQVDVKFSKPFPSLATGLYYSMYPKGSVVDPDSLNPDPDRDPDPAL
jgi:hypothetical protein